ncbi:MAG: hypothetical protein LBU12_00225 [Deltaproteobacteria bacterium]|jgi:hypothetical protein|nr:hypothetical protein [Deltaproteobacteria bacterium]
MSVELTAFLNFRFEILPTTTKVVIDEEVSFAERWQLNWRSYVKLLATLGVSAEPDSRPALHRYAHPQPDDRTLQELIVFQSDLRQELTEIVVQKKISKNLWRRIFTEADGVPVFLSMPKDFEESLTPANIDSLNFNYTYGATTYRIYCAAIIRELIVSNRLFNLRLDENNQFYFDETQPASTAGPAPVPSPAPAAALPDVPTPVQRPQPPACETLSAEPAPLAVIARPVSAPPAAEAQTVEVQAATSLAPAVQASGTLVTPPKTGPAEASVSAPEPTASPAPPEVQGDQAAADLGPEARTLATVAADAKDGLASEPSAQIAEQVSSQVPSQVPEQISEQVPEPQTTGELPAAQQASLTSRPADENENRTAEASPAQSPGPQGHEAQKAQVAEPSEALAAAPEASQISEAGQTRQQTPPAAASIVQDASAASNAAVPTPQVPVAAPPQAPTTDLAAKSPAGPAAEAADTSGGEPTSPTPDTDDVPLLLFDEAELPQAYADHLADEEEELLELTDRVEDDDETTAETMAETMGKPAAESAAETMAKTMAEPATETMAKTMAEPAAKSAEKMIEEAEAPSSDAAQAILVLEDAALEDEELEDDDELVELDDLVEPDEPAPTHYGELMDLGGGTAVEFLLSTLEQRILMKQQSRASALSTSFRQKNANRTKLKGL